MTRKNIYLLLLILGTAFWGISFSITKIAIGYGSSTVFLFYRFFLATIVLSLLFSKSLKKVSLKTFTIGAELAVPLMLGIYLQTLGIKYSSASQTSFVAGTTVILIPILKIILYRKLAPAKVWIAASLALVGLSIISVKSDFTINIGDLYTIIGAFGFAYYLIRVEKHAKNVAIITTIVPMFGVCTLLSLALVMVDSNRIWFPVHQEFWTGIFYCAILSTAYMYSISNLAQQYLSSEQVSIIYLFEPIFGAIAASFLLGELLTWKLVLGGSLIFLGMLISELKINKFKFLTQRMVNAE